MTDEDSPRPTGNPVPSIYGGVAALGGATVRAAFVGRVSDKDLQDPTLSIPRQLSNAHAVLMPGWVMVGHFWDVESGRLELADRGRSGAHSLFDVSVPRDGGLPDLLDRVRRRDPGFDVVICESIDRVARRHWTSAMVEHELESRGIAILAADEPIGDRRKRAALILMRRMKQAIAEYQVNDLLEKSWDGYCEHTRQGWNIGAAPYGYLARRIPHPVPAKRARGEKKTRLDVDPVRGPVIAQVYRWRVVERLSRAAITDRLNADPGAYPPPEPVGARRAKGAWSARTVRSILRNPKYTGYMVWNVCARKTGNGRENPREQWLWSEQPMHDAIVSLEMFEAAYAMEDGVVSSRGHEPARHPQARRAYLLRSYVDCAACGRRMFGKTRRTTAYMACQPSTNQGRGAHLDYPGHQASAWVREDALVAGVVDFFARRILGANRRDYLARDLAAAPDQATADWQRRVDTLAATIDELTAARRRLLATLETTAADDAFTLDVRDRINQIAAEQHARGADLAELRANPPDTRVDAPDLLDELGAIPPAALAAAPGDLLRRLFDVFNLRVAYDHRTGTATCQVTISDDTLPLIHNTLTSVSPNPTYHNECDQSVPDGAARSPSDCAPGSVRCQDMRDTCVKT